MSRQSAVPIVPCSDLDATQAFYARLGFRAVSTYPHEGYVILETDGGASIHLTRVDSEWIDATQTAYGIYVYAENVAALAAAMGATAEAKPWGLLEFSVSDPSGTLVRVGWPTG